MLRETESSSLQFIRWGRVRELKSQEIMTAAQRWDDKDRISVELLGLEMRQQM